MIHHEVRGSGTSVVLVHSGGMSGRQWRRLADRLSARHRVVVPDLLGYGKNPPWPPEAPFHFRDDVREVVALVDACEGSAHVVGHSYGGLVAAFVALERPLRSLTLFDPVTFGVLRDPDDAEGLADLARASSPVFLDDEHGGSPAWLEHFVDYWSGAGAFRALPPPARAAFERVGRKVYYEVRSLMQDRSPASTFAALACPTLLMTSELSPPAARRVVDILARTVRSARVVTVEGAGHMAPITHPDRVNEPIMAFLASVDEAR